MTESHDPFGARRTIDTPLGPDPDTIRLRDLSERRTLDEMVFEFPVRLMEDPGFPWIPEIEGFVPEREFDWDKYYPTPVAEGARIDIWKIAHEPGSKAWKTSGVRERS